MENSQLNLESNQESATMPQRERLRVWRGELKKTAGGLTKNDLQRNARGKIVSKKKSRASTNENNLGKWLRSAGDSFGGLLQEKGMPARNYFPTISESADWSVVSCDLDFSSF